MSQIKVIGTNHISKQSKQEIKKEFSEFAPDIIAVELDINRYKALKNNTMKNRLKISAIKDIGFTGFIFALIGRMIQKKLGKIMNVTPGEEMLLASNLARHNKLKLYLIDKDIRKTLKDLSKKVSIQEKLKMVKDVLLSPFKKNTIKIDLAKVPKDKLLKKIMFEFKKNYPQTYDVLLNQRNIHMSKQIKTIQKTNPEQKIMVVVGAGHKEGILELL